MMLHEVLRDVLYLIGDQGCSNVTIAREGEHAYQVRFEPDKSAKRGWRSEGRRWIDQTPTIPNPKPTSIRGTLGPYVGWSQWSGFMGWNVDNVLADDWQILDLGPALAELLKHRRMVSDFANSVTEEQGKRLAAYLGPDQAEQLRRITSLFAGAGPERTIRPAIDSSAVCPRCNLRDELVRATNYGRDTGRLHCRRCNLTLEPTP